MTTFFEIAVYEGKLFGLDLPVLSTNRDTSNRFVNMYMFELYPQLYPRKGGTPYIRMIGMIIIFFRGCNQQFSIFLGVIQAKSFKKIKLVFVRV